MNILQLLAAFVRLGGTTADEGADRGPAASAGAGGAGAEDHSVSRARADGRLGWLGADGHLSGELVLDCLIAVRATLARIAAGGMRDQVRGGIARYSVDRQWFVPHFEK